MVTLAFPMGLPRDSTFIVAGSPTIIELNTAPTFQDEFVNAMFLPNMVTERFPSVAAGG